eukprot:gi/632969128/ref/XP_007900920.1/ PREDICTED: TNF receptor-associated factor 2-like isoform X1 [Callorhinchus milii]
MSYIGPLCRQVLRNPAKTACGHRYCMDYIQSVSGKTATVCQMSMEEGVSTKDTTTDPDVAHKADEYRARIGCQTHVDPGMSEQQNVPREKIDGYENKGLKRKTCCLFQAVGCKYKGTREKIRKHEEESVGQHIGLLLNEITKLNPDRLPPAAANTLPRLEAEVQELRLRVAAFSNSHRLNELCDKLQGFCRTAEAHIAGVEAKSASFEHTLDAAKEMKKCSEIVAVLNSWIQLGNQLILMENQLVDVEHQLQQAGQNIQDCTARLEVMEQLTHSGVFIWRIAQLEKRLQEAVDGTTPYLDSGGFYSCKYGYKMCLRIYLNGHERAQGIHISLYFILLQGHYDTLNQWPFRKKVKLSLLNVRDQRYSIVKCCVLSHLDLALQRPAASMNAPCGFSTFVSLPELKLRFSEFVDNDEMFVSAEVDSSSL